MGCQTTSQPAVDELPTLIQIQQYFEAGELYHAKKLASAFLNENPNDVEAQLLMAKILEEEIAQHKDAFDTKALEELDSDEKTLEAKTWLERSQGFLDAGQYEQAAWAAEKVFQFDPHNQKASQLLDRIKKDAWVYGKKQIDTGNNMIEDEVGDRVAIYRRQASQWMAERKWGAARFAVEKILLLLPEDKDALNLLKTIKSQSAKRD